jgi:hypothetical protein
MKKTKTLLQYITLGSLTLTPALVLAQQGTGRFFKPVGEAVGFFGALIQTLNWIIPAIAVLAFMGLVVVFILNKMGFEKLGKVEKGTTIIYALVALAALFLVYPLIGILGEVFGVNSNSKSIQAPSLPTVRY